MVQILNDSVRACITEKIFVLLLSDCSLESSWESPLSVVVNFTGSWCLVTTLGI